MAEDNILIRIKGEADMSDAQVQMQDLSTKSKVLKEQMSQLIAVEEKYRQEQAQRIAAGKGESELIDKVLQKKRQQRVELQAEINANERNIQSLKNSASAYAATQGAGKRLAMQVRQIREELSKMEMAGDTSSQAFVDLSVKAAQLQDQMGDTQTQIRILASDTKNLDAALSIGTGLAGAFNTATSAAALLGGESEALQQAFLKVQAAMAVLNGVQQVANTLNKDSAGNVVIRTAMQKLFNKEKAKEATITTSATAAATANAAATTAEATATTAATKATNKFTAALLANPVAWIIAGIAAIVAGYMTLTKHLEKAAEKQRDLNGLLKEGSERMQQSAEDAEYAARMMEAEGKSAMDVLQERRKRAKADLGAAQKDLDEANKRINGKWADMTDEETEAYNQLVETEKKAYENLKKINNDITILDVQQKHDESERAKEAAKAAADRRKQENKQRLDDIKEAGRQAEELHIQNMEDGLEKDLELIRLEYRRKKEAIKGNSAEELKLRSELEIQKQKKLDKKRKEYEDKAIQAEYTLAKLRIQNEYDASDKGYDARVTYLNDMYKLDKEYIGETEENQTLKNEKLTSLEIKLKNDLSAIDDEIAQEAKDKADEIAEQIKNAIETAINELVELTRSVFDWIGESIQQQMDDLEHYYTTDVEEAKESANKKYMTEKEYNDKMIALKQKQARLDKAQAAFDIGINTATAIMRAWAESTVAAPYLTALIAAVGAVQLAAVLAKPLPQYAKGRKGGKGEMALVGEKGPELMYVPQGASIVPNNKLDTPEAWRAYGVPQPEIESALLNFALTQAGIDYDRLGRTIAENMPKAKTVNVSIDRTGIGIYEGRNAHKIHNQKYTGAWN